MSRIFVMGYELPGMAQGAIEARSYRTWQFVQPLLENGHEICFIASHRQNQTNLPHQLHSTLTYHRLKLSERSWLGKANEICNEFQPDALVGVMFNNGLRATRLALKRPLWIDLYGDRVAEAQIGSFVANSDRGIGIMFEYINAILRGADVYSTCSTPQKYSVVGQLGMVGRVNRHTMGYEFVHAILPGAPSSHAQAAPKLTVRGERVPKDAFMVLWCGGYNVWTDVDVLFQALEYAMEKDPYIHYVSAGAGVQLTNNNSYERFLAMIAASAHRDRFHMLGWQNSDVIPGLYQQADVGVNLDAFCYETQLGTRTRLAEMMHHRLPVITTLGCELSQVVKNQGLGLTFAIGDARTFAEHLLTLATDRPLQQKLAAQAQNYTNNQLSFQNTTRSFLDWARNPVFAPDRAQNHQSVHLKGMEYRLRGVVRSLLWKIWALERGD